jgi:hypothetical protein
MWILRVVGVSIERKILYDAPSRAREIRSTPTTVFAPTWLTRSCVSRQPS